MDNNLILYLPFDDPDGSIAYDFSIGRSNGTIANGARFSKDARFGKSLDINGGSCSTGTAIPFTSNFTVALWVKPVGNKIGWLLNFSAVNTFKEQWIDVVSKQWVFFAFVRKGNSFSVFKGTELIYNESITGNPVGFTINEISLFESYSSIDDLRVFNVAKTASEIFKLQADTDVEYFIDGTNFKDYGVQVSSSSGLTGKLATKEGLTVDWDNYHGKVVDRSRPRFKERTITLECYIEAKSRGDYVNAVNRFFDCFIGAGTHRLKVEFDGVAKPLVYEIACDDAVDPTKKWGYYNNELMVGTFKIKLEEDEPVKRVLRHIGAANSTVHITMTSTKLLNIYWGDGTHTYNVSGTSNAQQHTYTNAGEYDIIITGVIEDISDFSTDAIVVWNRLQ